MSRKVFISFLGTGNYRPLKYKKDHFVSQETKYIQEATLAYHNSIEPWNEQDIAYILLTDDAEKAHWTDLHTDIRTKEITPHRGLETCLKDLGLPIRIEPIRDVPGNGTENDFWTIFRQMISIIEEGDELYLDLTHSFRYLPMLMLVFGKYAEFLKNAKIKSITYGNFESAKDGVGPLVDLMPLSLLQDWSFAAGQYLKNGSTSDLVDLSKNHLKPILATDTNAQQLNQYINNLDRIINERQTCRGKLIYSGKCINYMKEGYPRIQGIVIEPLQPILEHIQQSIEPYSQNSIQNIFETVKWCNEKGLYQQAVTLLQEGICTKICMSVGLDWGVREQRECVSAAFATLEDPSKLSFDKDKNLKEEEKQFLIQKAKEIQDLPQISILKKKWSELTILRNSYNHGGFRADDTFSAETIKANIGTLIKDLIPLVDSLQADTEPDTQLPNILINLSNHPSTDWSDEQKEAAISQYGPITDLPFPNIDPSLDEEGIQNIVKDYCEKVKDISQNSNPAVHIMGEMNFVFAMVKALHNEGIPCIASTTHRVTEDIDGKHISIFRFVRFRRYE